MRALWRAEDFPPLFSEGKCEPSGEQRIFFLPKIFSASSKMQVPRPYTPRRRFRLLYFLQCCRTYRRAVFFLPETVSSSEACAGYPCTLMCHPRSLLPEFIIVIKKLPFFGTFFKFLTCHNHSPFNQMVCCHILLGNRLSVASVLESVQWFRFAR